MNETGLLVLLLLLSVEAMLLLVYRQNWSDKTRRYRAHFDKERTMLESKIAGLKDSNEALRQQMDSLKNKIILDDEE